MPRAPQLSKPPRPLRLDNGTLILCQPTRRLASQAAETGSKGALGTTAGGTCAVQFWIAAGTADERKAQHGAAHFTEHMVFRPWGDGPAADLASRVEGLGGDINAYTSHDETVYYATFDAAQLMDGLELMRQAIFEARFDAAAVDKERAIILEELEQYADEASSVVSEASAAQVHPGHPYGRPILGTRSELLGLSASRLRAYHRRNYVGQRLTVVVVGPVERRAVHGWARRHLSGLRPGAPRRAPKRYPAGPAMSVRGLAVPGVETELRYAWAIPGVAARDAVALDLLAVLFGQGEGARMSSRLRREQGLALDAHAGVVAGVRGGSFVMAASAKREKLLRCAQEMFRLRRELELRPPTAAELDAARTMLETSLVYRHETVAGQAHALGHYACVAGDVEAEARYFRDLRGLTSDELVASARRHLRLDRLQISAGLPRAHFDAKSRRRVTRALRRELEATLPAKKSRVARRKRWRKEGRVWCLELEVGTRLIVAPDPALPLAAGCLAWPGGQRAEDVTRAGVGQLVARLAAKADEERTALGLSRWLDARAAGLDGFFGRSSEGLSFEATTAHFDELLELALGIAARPSFDELELDRERAATLEALAAENEDGASLSVARALAKLYGASHPYGRSLRGDPRVIRGLGAKDLEAACAGRGLEDAVFGIAGDVDAEAIAERVEALLRAWPAQRHRTWPEAEAARPASATSRVQARRAGLRQSHVTLAYAAVPEGHPDVAALELVTEILGAQSGRLFLALRENEGLVYHVGVGLMTGLDAGHIVVHAAASEVNFRRAKARLVQSIDRFVEEGPAPEELERARATLLGQLERTWQRRSATATQLALHGLRTRELSAAWALAREIETASAEAVAGAARRYLACPGVLSTVRPR